MKKAAVATLMAGALLVVGPAAEAGHGHGHGDALAAGVLGLMVGAALASPPAYYYDEPRTVIIERGYRPPPRVIYYDYDYGRHHRPHRHWSERYDRRDWDGDRGRYR